MSIVVLKRRNTAEDMGVSEKGPKADHRLNAWEIVPRVGTSFENDKTVIVDEHRFGNILSRRDPRFPTNQTKMNRLNVTQRVFARF